jgi:hypothetical protein
MAKSYHSIKKRNKELARKQKQEQKRQRKFDKNSVQPEAPLDTAQDSPLSCINNMAKIR